MYMEDLTSWSFHMVFMKGAFGEFHKHLSENWLRCQIDNSILPMKLALGYAYLVNVRYVKGLFTSTYSAIYEIPMYNHSKHLVKLHSSGKYINLQTVHTSICPKLSKCPNN